LLALGAVWLLARAGDGDGSGTPSRNTARAVERALDEESLHGNFPTLATARNISCQPYGEYRERRFFACGWTLETGDQGAGTWMLGRGGNLARLSEGGAYGAPPRDSGEASRRVTEVVRQRGDANAKCRRSGGRSWRSGAAAADAYSCAVLDPTGAPIIVDGEEMRVVWRWNRDGTVAREAMDAAAAPR
jgi:hypothetical protein